MSRRSSESTVHSPAELARLEFARDVAAGLSNPEQRKLPSRYLYDDLGTALFEAITLLPEYGLTRADERLLRRLAPELGRRDNPPACVIELGSGGGRKTKPVLDALRQQRAVEYVAIDVSAAALDRCRLELSGLDGVTLRGIEASYLDGLRQSLAQTRQDGPALVLFLGSTIGNFDRAGAEEFIANVRRCLDPGDMLLLGTDLEKPVDRMLLAYDDPTGVTAAFNLNLLGRINRELDADFDLRGFRHEARYNSVERRIEMHLRSEKAQHVTIRGAGCEVRLNQGETIWTEASHKFDAAEIRSIAQRTGFRCQIQWIDREWPFAESLLIAV